ncbi:hypothetical protein DM860_013573 [Cuscuta australis]|uniref:BED-type domain-containing protein n=1 Tax=Cuscuta australis TaxID=267555 RepID=A0A328EAR8_9ASTE|nr:hypothetical protein DM860_013573 [Cuscuta australis]
MASNLEPIPVTSQKHDPAWKHCQMYKNGDRVQLKCVYCGKVFKGGGIHRIKEHLAGQKGNASTCMRVQPEVRILMQESLNGAALKRRKKQKLDTQIVLTGNIEPLSELSPGVELLPVVDSLEQSFGAFGCQDEGEGTSNQVTGRKKKGRIRKAITSKEVVNGGITRANDQVHMVIARFLLDAGIPFEAVKSPYFQPMIDAIASQESGIMGPTYHELRSWILKNSIQEVRNEISRCSHTWTRTGCSVLVEESTTERGKSVINFSVHCLEGTMFLRQHLQSMVTSVEWMESPHSKKPEGFSVLDLIGSESFWSSCTLITRLTGPLLRLLRIVGSKKRPAMGYVYAGLYRAKEAIKKELAHKNDYLVYWNIIDHRWAPLQRHPLHAAGFYLNPRYFYATVEDVHLYLRSLVYDCIERLVPDPNIQDRIVKETSSYQNAAGDFGRKMAVRARDTLFPGELPFTENFLPFRHIVILMEHHGNKSREDGSVDPISYENLPFIKDWVSEREPCLYEPASSDWMVVDPPSSNAVLLSPQVEDDFEALGAGFGDYEIFDGVKDMVKDENGDDTL